MDVDLTTGIVRILKPDGTTAGTGFVVSDDGLIATCSHVVQSEKSQQQGEPRPEYVDLVFYAAGGHRRARVEPDWWRPANAEDVAILRLEGDLPESVQPLPLSSSQASRGHEFTSRGYRLAEHFPEGLEAEGKIQGSTSYQGQPVLQLLTNQIDRGMSGAPIWDVKGRRVVGMVNTFWETSRHVDAWLAFATPTETLRTVCPDLVVSDIRPYQGLAAFTEVDAEFFFGRKALVTDLVDHLRSNPRFLAVVGPSGSGKSSVVQAGLFPAIRRGEVPGSGDWHLLTLRPGADPFAALSAAGLDASQDSDLQAVVRAFLEMHPQVKRLVLFADHFEELFALCSKPMQEHFLSQLLALLESDLRATVVLALRADFYGHLLRYRPLVDWLKIGQVNVPPMGLEELRAAVEEPALRLGLRFEPGLVETIVEEAGAADHPLPLLESALTQLWEKREDGTLTHAAYQAVGQVAGAVGQWAEEAYTKLVPEERPLVQRIFTRLVRYGEGEVADTRQRQSLSELVTRPEEQEPLHQLVRRLADARLLVTGGDRGAETVEIIHDALLQQWGRFRHWTAEQREFYLWRQRLDERLQEWEEKGQDEGALLRGALLAEAERWLTERPEGLNPDERAYIQDSVALQERERATREQRGRRLALAAVGAAAVFLILALLALGQRNEARRAQATTITEVNNRATAQAQAKAAQAAAEAEAAVRATAQSEAEQRTRVARAGELAAQAQAALEQHPPRSLLLAVEALNVTLQANEPPVPAAEQALRDALRQAGGHPLSGHDSGVRGVALSPDGRWLATGSWDATARLWNLTTSNPTADPIVLRGHDDAVWPVAFSPDGCWLATGSDDGTARLWNLTASDPAAAPIVLRGHDDAVWAVAFSPDGRWLVTAAIWDNTARLWDVSALLNAAPTTVSDPAVDPIVLGGHEHRIDEFAFSPDGRWLATGSNDATARLWDLTASNPAADPIVLRGHEDGVYTVAFSPDGRWLATRAGIAVQLWDLTVSDPTATPFVLRGHEGTIWTVTFSPDGRWLATGSDDATARLWNLTATNPAAAPVVLRGHEGSIHTIAFSPDGRWLVTTRGAWALSGGHDPTARLWDLTASDPAADPIVLRGHEGAIYAVAFSPDGHWLATRAGIAVQLWDLTVSDPAVDPIVLGGHEHRIDEFAFSPDGCWLATGSDDGTARLWDLTASDLAADPIVMRGHEGRIDVVAFSPDGRWLVTADIWDNTARLWDVSALLNAAPTVSDPAANPFVLRGHEGSIHTIAFSPDGRWLATGSDDATARLWNLTASDPAADPIVLRGHEGAIGAVAFGPDGRWLATGSDDATAWLWDLTASDPAVDPIVLRGHEHRVDEFAFSPDGRWLATGSDDATAWLWDLTASDPAADPIVLRGHEHRVDEFAFSPDGRWLATTGIWDNTARLWDLTASDPAADPIVLRGHEGAIYAVAFGPDGRWLATGSDDATARLWDLTASDPTAAPVVLRGHEGSIHTIAFSPDGRRLVTTRGAWSLPGGHDPTARLWDLTASDPAADPIVLRGHERTIWDVAFSPDGRWLATGSDDATARLWDLTVSDPASDPIVLRGHEGAIGAVAFGPDGRWLASETHATVRLWVLQLDELIDLACRTAGRNLTFDEWRQYLSDQPYRPTCPNLPVPEE